MPLRLSDIEQYGVPISFLDKGQVQVRTGPCSAAFWDEPTIPLDGKYYICAGTIFLKNGIELRANFEINTHTFDFLERDSVKVYIEKEKAWYSMEEEELYNIMGISREDAMPYRWMTDRPLSYPEKGPYPMNFQSQ